MKKLLLTGIILILSLTGCGPINEPLTEINPENSTIFHVPYNFTVGIYTNNAGIAIPNVIMQNGKSYLIYRAFGKDSSVLCSNVSGGDLCISNKGEVLGIKDTEMQKNVAIGLTKRVLLRHYDLTSEFTKLSTDKIANMNFSNNTLVPDFLKDSHLNEELVPLDGCFQRKNTTATEVTCYGSSYMPYYSQTSTSTGSTIQITDSIFFMSRDTISDENVKNIMSEFKKSK